MLAPVSASAHQTQNTPLSTKDFIGPVSKLNYGNMGAIEFLNSRPPSDSADFSAFHNALHSGDTKVGKWLNDCFRERNHLANKIKSISSLSPEQQLAVRDLLFKAPADRSVSDIIATGLITQADWDKCLSEACELLRSDQAILILLNDYPAVEHSLQSGNFSDCTNSFDFFSPEVEKSKIKILRSAGCNFNDSNLLRFITGGIFQLRVLVYLLESDAEISSGLAKELILRIALLDTNNDKEDFAVKLKAASLLGKKIDCKKDEQAQNSQAETDYSDAGKAFKKAIDDAERKGGYHFVRYRAQRFSAPRHDDYVPAPEYSEHGLLVWVIKAGANVNLKGKGILRNIGVYDANRLHFLANLDTERAVGNRRFETKYGTGKIFQNVVDSVLAAMAAACEAGDDVNGITQEGYPPLFFAALARSPGGEVVKFLLERGARLDESVTVFRPKNQVIHVLPLTWAVMGGLRHEIFPGALKVLLEAGADPNKKDGDGFTVLDRLIRFPHADISLEMADYLLNQGAQLTSLDHDGEVSAWRKFVEEKGRSDLYERLTLLSAQGTSAPEESSQPAPESVIKSDY